VDGQRSIVFNLGKTWVPSVSQ